MLAANGITESALRGARDLELNSRVVMLLLAALITVSALVCSESGQASDLIIHRNIWRKSGITDYTLEYQEIRPFGGEYIRSHVTNGVVSTIEHADSGVIIYPNSREGPDAYAGMSERKMNYLLSIATIDGLFAMIQEERRWNRDDSSVSYNAELGYPEMFLIYHREAIDGFYAIRILSLSPS